MRFLIAAILASLSVWLWLFVFRAVGAGLIMLPRGNAWWRETRYYDRTAEPVRFWLTASLWIILAALAGAAAVGSLLSPTA